MPNKEEHQLAGGIIGGILVLLILMITSDKTTLLDKILIVINVGICIFGAMLPDLIEPANRRRVRLVAYFHPYYGYFNRREYFNHRQEFHSWEALLFSFFILIVSTIISFFFLSMNVMLLFVIFLYLAFLFLGYGIHLAQDSRTTSNLPFLFDSTKKFLKEMGLV